MNNWVWNVGEMIMMGKPKYSPKNLSQFQEEECCIRGMDMFCRWRAHSSVLRQCLSLNWMQTRFFPYICFL